MYKLTLKSEYIKGSSVIFQYKENPELNKGREENKFMNKLYCNVKGITSMSIGLFADQ
jgi:hypothetical protein